MTNPAIELTNLSALPNARPVIRLLELTPAVRPRKRMHRTPCGKKLAAMGYTSPHDSWRPLLRRYLRRRLPQNCWIYVGGHHIAVMMRYGAFQKSSFTVARFIEVPAKKA